VETASTIASPVPRAPAPLSRLVGAFAQADGWRGGLSLTTQFRWASLLVLVVAMLGTGNWIAQQTEYGTLNRTGALTALYVDSVLQDPLEVLATQDRLNSQQVATLDHLLHDTALGQRIVDMRVWSTTGEVLYSSDPTLVGRTFPISDKLSRALRGWVAADLSRLETSENASLRDKGSQFLEVYAPVRQQDANGHVIGVVEFYEKPDDMMVQINNSRIQIWGLVGAATLAVYLLLAGIVHRGNAVIRRQQNALRGHVAELEHLHLRLREAAGRTTTLNERALRRIGADLHAGPGQALALALLRIETIHTECQCGCLAQDEVSTVKGAVRDAMNELRSIATGLRMPELEPLTPAAVVQRAVLRHERRSGHRVTLRLGPLPEQAPLSVKITLFRTLEEALSNASRHAGGTGLEAHAESRDDGIALGVSDAGAGFVPGSTTEDEHLGLANLHEHIELLGGSFSVESSPGEGTRLAAWLPLREVPA
jgi:signal transduction histidine kinase